MKVAIRVDSSDQIGIGHVMRCLTLAVGLQEMKADITFLTRSPSGNMCNYIREKGYRVIELPKDDSSKPNDINIRNRDPHLHWLGVSRQVDAVQTCVALAEDIPDLLVVDHYALNRGWENELISRSNHLMVIDDLANRPHVCDMLLDQTLGRVEKDYSSLIPPGARMLLGTDYAMLRPEFLHWRQFSLRRRINPVLNRILVTFGGIDADNHTALVLKILDQCDFLLETVEVCVVVGGNSPHLDELSELVDRLRLKSKIFCNAFNMAELMAKSDLCVGSSGTTSWERCCLGLPTITVVVAQNQEQIAENLLERNAALVAELPLEESLPRALAKLNFEYMKTMSMNAANLVDGRGLDRVVEAIRSLDREPGTL